MDTETLLEIFMKTAFRTGATVISALVLGLSLQGHWSIAIARTNKTEPTRIRVPYTNSNRPAGHKICDCPYDRMRNGNLCGKTSAYAKEGGDESLTCYAGETRSRQMWWYSSDTKTVDPRAGI